MKIAPERSPRLLLGSRNLEGRLARRVLGRAAVADQAARDRLARRPFPYPGGPRTEDTGAPGDDATRLANRAFSSAVGSSTLMTPSRASCSRFLTAVAATPRSPGYGGELDPLGRGNAELVGALEDRCEAARNADSRIPTATSVPAVSPKKVPESVRRARVARPYHAAHRAGKPRPRGGVRRARQPRPSVEDRWKEDP